MTDEPRPGPLQPILDRVEDAWLEMLAVIQQEAPEYARFVSDEDEAEWAANVRHLLDLFMELAAGRRWLTPAEQQAIRQIGATRFDQGIEFEAVRASVAAAIGVAQTWIVREYTPRTDEDKVALDEVLASLHRFGGAIADLLREGHALRRQERTKTASSQLVKLATDIAEGRLLDEDEYRRRCNGLGCDPAVERSLVLLADETAAGHVLARVRERVPSVHVLHRREAGTPHSILILALPSSGAWSRIFGWLGESADEIRATALVVGPSVSAADLYYRYVSAAALVPHLRQLAAGAPLLHAEVLLPQRIAAAIPPDIRESLRREVLGGLDSFPREVTERDLETLAVHVRNRFSPKDVQDEMGVNRKTVFTRRHEFKKRSGRSFSDSEDRMVLALMYYARLLD